MRIKSNIWVAAYLRRCQTEGVFGAVRRKGSEEAGAVFVKLALLDGNALLFTPAPQSTYDEDRPSERNFVQWPTGPVAEQAVEERLVKEISFDPDVWIVEIEDRAGRHFLDLAKGVRGVCVPGAMQRETLLRRPGTVSDSEYGTAPDQQRTARALRSIRDMVPHPLRRLLRNLLRMRSSVSSG